MTSRRRRELPSGTGYPRVCGECGQAFLARRTTARWCSDKCRLRAWRHAARAQDRRQIDQLREQVEQLRTALLAAQSSNLCAAAGCQNRTAQSAGIGDVDLGVPAVPWRSPEWNDHQVRTLRARLTTTTQELERLREENGLMRRWIHERLHADPQQKTRPRDGGRGPGGMAREC
jgi:hypothetical protein